MTSKMVTDRQKLADAVTAATVTHTDDVSSGLLAVLAPVLEDNPEQSLVPPDVSALQRSLGGYLQVLKQRLVEADETNLGERFGDREPRRRRDQAAAELRSALVKVRSAAEGAFGPGGGDLVGIEGRTARDPVVLQRQAERVIERLRSEELPVPAARLPGLQATPAEWVAVLEPPLAELTRTLVELTEERRRAEKTLSAKARAMSVYDASLGRVARLLEALYELAGFEELAERVRPAARQAGRSAEPSEEIREMILVPPGSGDASSV